MDLTSILDVNTTDSKCSLKSMDVSNSKLNVSSSIVVVDGAVQSKSTTPFSAFNMRHEMVEDLLNSMNYGTNENEEDVEAANSVGNNDMLLENFTTFSAIGMCQEIVEDILKSMDYN